MTVLKRLTAVATIGALALGAAACTKESPAVVPPTPTAAPVTTPAATATPTAKPTPTLTAKQQAEADAIAMVKKEVALVNQLSADPPASSTELRRALAAVSIGAEYVGNAGTVALYRDKGWHQQGELAIDQVKVTGAKLFRQKTPGVVSTVVVSACADSTGAAVVDKAGRRVSPGSKGSASQVEYSVTNAVWPDRDGWRVARMIKVAPKCF